MLAFERRVVDALIETGDPAGRARVHAWVDASLREMPELLRFGVVAESVAFGVLAHAWRGSLEQLLASLERNPIGLVRSYVRLFRSLVLYGELELTGREAA
jgi:hypothetical protein